MCKQLFAKSRACERDVSFGIKMYVQQKDVCNIHVASCVVVFGKVVTKDRLRRQEATHCLGSCVKRVRWRYVHGRVRSKRNALQTQMPMRGIRCPRNAEHGRRRKTEGTRGKRFFDDAIAKGDFPSQDSGTGQVWTIFGAPAHPWGRFA